MEGEHEELRVVSVCAMPNAPASQHSIFSRRLPLGITGAVAKDEAKESIGAIGALSKLRLQTRGRVFSAEEVLVDDGRVVTVGDKPLVSAVDHVWHGRFGTGADHRLSVHAELELTQRGFILLIHAAKLTFTCLSSSST